MTDRRRPPRPRVLDDPPAESLLDVVDSLIDKGVALDGEIVLGLADVDLIYLRLGAVVAAADKVLGPDPGAPQRTRSHPVLTQIVPEGLSTSKPASRREVRPPAAASLTTSAPSAIPRAQETSDASRSVIRLVLTLVDFVRGLLERQVLRRVEDRTLSADEIERVGRALMLLEETIREMAARHDIELSSLNLDLGPLGRLQ